MKSQVSQGKKPLLPVSKKSKSTKNDKINQTNSSKIEPVKRKPTKSKSLTKNKEEDKPKVVAVDKKALPSGTGKNASKGKKKKRGKKRKAKISPEELKRRELKKWLSVKADILGVRIALAPPEPPYFLQVERRLLAEREQRKREHVVAQATAGALRARRLAHKKHDQAVLTRHTKFRAQKLRKALQNEKRVQDHITKIEEQRAKEQRKRNHRLFKQRMNEIKLTEQRQKEEKLRREDEQRVARILKNRM